MTSGEEAAAGMRRILCLAPDCDPTTLSLSAEEGFLLSRIDGHTPWRLLREIGGIEPDEADLCLEGWIASGYVKVAGMAPEASRPRPARARSAANAPPKPGTATTPGPIDESLIDAGLDLEVEVQRKILEFEAGLGRSYHDLLGVKPDADTKQVKRAYFKLSKEFHPDRYFRREIGGYAARLDAIFKRVLEAYEILSDPKLCAELAEQGVEAGGSAEAGGGAVRVTATGLLRVASIELDDTLMSGLSGPVTPDQQSMAEELIADAVNNALQAARLMAETEAAAVANELGLPLPPGGLGGLIS